MSSQAARVTDVLAWLMTVAGEVLVPLQALVGFRDDDRGVSFPATLSVALDLAEAAVRSPAADLRLAGELLRTAVAHYVRVVDDGFLRMGRSVHDLVVAYAEDHDPGPARAVPS